MGVLGKDIEMGLQKKQSLKDQAQLHLLNQMALCLSLKREVIISEKYHLKVYNEF